MIHKYCLILIAILLVSCSNIPAEEPTQTGIAATTIISPTHTAFTTTPITLPTKTPLPSPTSTPTQKPFVTLTPSPTITATPTSSPPPTEDLSFYDIAPCLPKNTSFEKGTVTQVYDGDTIDVQFADGNIYPIRYIGIDAPENDRPFFADAYNANSDMVLNKQVILIKDVSETDQYDRLLRYVIVDHIFVNLELVRAGFAQAMEYPPDIACADIFSSAESQTRASLIGIWQATQTPEASAAQVVIVTVDKRAEYVDIQNIGSFDVDLTGWNLVSERGRQECPLSGMLRAGETLRIWSMTAQGAGLSCGYSSPIWNNSEKDPAVLYNPQGVEVSRK
jgi:endonuclease YncB( thermonuclease family)